MSSASELSEAARIQREYARRAAEIPADFYDLNKPANYFSHSRLARRIVSLLKRHGRAPLDGHQVADIGCGAGNWLLEFIRWGARPEDLFGIDLNASRIEQARQRVPLATLVHGDASALALPDASIDLACQFTAFSSVLDPAMKQALATEMLRIVRRTGAILWYDLRVNNPTNPAVRAIGPNELRRLFPDCLFDVQRVTLAPPLARAIAPHSYALASALEQITFLRSHYLALIGKKA